MLVHLLECQWWWRRLHLDLCPVGSRMLYVGAVSQGLHGGGDARISFSALQSRLNHMLVPLVRSLSCLRRWSAVLVCRSTDACVLSPCLGSSSCAYIRRTTHLKLICCLGTAWTWLSAAGNAAHKSRKNNKLTPHPLCSSSRSSSSSRGS